MSSAGYAFLAHFSKCLQILPIKWFKVFAHGPVNTGKAPAYSFSPVCYPPLFQHKHLREGSSIWLRGFGDFSSPVLDSILWAPGKWEPNSHVYRSPAVLIKMPLPKATWSLFLVQGVEDMTAGRSRIQAALVSITKRKQKSETGSGGLFPAASLSLLKVPYQMSNSATNWNRAFKYISLLRTFLIQTPPHKGRVEEQCDLLCGSQEA